MTFKTILNRTALPGLAALSLLAACGNTPGKVDSKSVLSGFLAGKQAQPPQVDIGAALQATKAPVILAVIEKTKAVSPLLEIESNGAYHTFATPSRQTLTLRQGVVTATRGLSNDIMSSDADDTLRLLKQRQAGQTRRAMRYLTGDEQIVTLSFDCTMTVGGTQKIAAGEVSATARAMNESCTGEGLSFTNTYVVDASGHVLTSRQWVNPTIGPVALQVLRR
ncbi:MAG: YjbF family lipoprotein [Thalassovita sp.]|nr:YjbF family lipoprotein [Thalassovita sp.]